MPKVLRLRRLGGRARVRRPAPSMGGRRSLATWDVTQSSLQRLSDVEDDGRDAPRERFAKAALYSHPTEAFDWFLLLARAANGLVEKARHGPKIVRDSLVERGLWIARVYGEIL